MRFDDSLATVMAAEMAGPAGIQSAWRQLVDLIGRGRGGRQAGDPGGAIDRLRAIRADVPAAVRAASARGLERADPPAGLVALFAEDEAAIASPVVRSARLTADEWIALLPTMQPATRGVLRHRRDLSERVERALASFGSHDFALPPADLTDLLIEPALVTPEVAPEPVAVAPAAPSLPEPEAEPQPESAPGPTFVSPEPSPFTSFAEAVRALPIVSDALDQARAVEPAPAPEPHAPSAPAGDDFAIAELVARIEAHQRKADDRGGFAPLPAAAAPIHAFRFETDARGQIRWCDHAARGPLIGRALADAAGDGAARGAFAKRTPIRDARFEVPGDSDAAGAWRISAVAAFDRASGRFIGYRGTARRPRRDEEPRLAAAAAIEGDSLRQLVHELRTPTNAISGFAEMIERELLGPVSPAYRDQAATIRSQTAGLLDAIEDIDTAARLETHRLELRPEAVPLIPLLRSVLADLQPLADLRGTFVTLDLAEGVAARGDARMLERLLSRLLTALVASAMQSEVLAGNVVADGDTMRFELTRPKAFVAADGAPLSGDAEVEQAAEGAPLLGTGFAFRLARGLAAELGGSLVVGPERLTLRLPAAVQERMEQATV